MKKIILLFHLSFLSVIGTGQEINPEILSTAGDTYQGSSIQLDWTLGELLIENIQNDSFQITQGFHQPHFIFTPVEELPKEIGTIHIFPNPSSDWIEMNLLFDQYRKVQIMLYDINGKLLRSKSAEGNEIYERMHLNDLPNSTYLIHFLVDENKFSQSFQIQKL